MLSFSWRQKLLGEVISCTKATGIPGKEKKKDKLWESMAVHQIRQVLKYKQRIPENLVLKDCMKSSFKTLCNHLKALKLVIQSIKIQMCEIFTRRISSPLYLCLLFPKKLKTLNMAQSKNTEFLNMQSLEDA